jgi:hypothetical protein
MARKNATPCASVHLSANVPIVPEPGTMLLFGTVVLLIGIVVRRKRLHVRNGLIDV